MIYILCLECDRQAEYILGAYSSLEQLRDAACSFNLEEYDDPKLFYVMVQPNNKYPIDPYEITYYDL